jgi:AraC-type DNA-binding domain-containing proteins
MKHIVFKATMEGLSVERVIRDSEFNMGNKHWHDECEIYYILEGKRCLFIGDQTYQASSGCLSIVDAKQMHQTTTSDKEAYHERILLLIEKEKFSTVSNFFAIDLNDFFQANVGVVEIPKEDRLYIEKLMTDIAFEINGKESGYQNIVQIRLVEFFTYLIRLKGNGMRRQRAAVGLEGSRVVFEIVEYVKENCAKAKSLEEIAKKFYIEKSYLSRIFKKNTGFTVNEFINIQKIKKAQRLLEDTDFSIAKIAVLVGYENITYFTKIFKKYVGYTPLKYHKTKNAYKESLRVQDGVQEK